MSNMTILRFISIIFPKPHVLCLFFSRSKLEIWTSCKDLFSELVVLANLVVCEYFKVPLEKTSQLQQCLLVSLLVCPLLTQITITS